MVAVAPNNAILGEDDTKVTFCSAEYTGKFLALS